MYELDFDNGNENLTESQPVGQVKPPPWLLTFADVTALLLAFFVMLFSMSDLQTERWATIASQVSTQETLAADQVVPIPQATETVGAVKVIEALPLEYLANVLQEKLSEDEILKRAVLHRLDRLVIVSLPSDALFPPGKAELTDQAHEALFRLGGVISTLGNKIDVHGHTDPDPTTDSDYDSKWAMSIARAITVAKKFRETGYVRKITMLGLADSRFTHLDPNLPEETRNRLARRVDVVVHPTTGEQ